MFSKESAVTFGRNSFNDLFFRKASKRQYMYLTGTIALPIIIYLIVRFFVLSDYPASYVTTMQNYLAGEPLTTRWASAIMLLGKYLLLLIIPYQQVCDYSFNQLPVVNFMNWKALLSLCVYLLLVIYALKNTSKTSDSLCCFVFVVTMSVYSNLVYLIGASFAERFVFIPSLSYCIALAYLLYRFSGMEREGDNVECRRRMGISATVLMVVLLFLRLKLMHVRQNGKIILPCTVPTSKNRRKVHVSTFSGAKH